MMSVKNMFFILFAFCLLTGCKEKALSHRESAYKYYNARNTGNYKELKTLIHDSITLISGDYVMPYNLDSFYGQFKWDSIFRSSYEVIDIEENDNQIIVTIAQNNMRNTFLKNNPLVYLQKISFTSGKISKIEELESIGANWNIWNKEKDALVDWIKNNHPELDGFSNDMTMNGAINYLKAIRLYETDKNAHD